MSSLPPPKTSGCIRERPFLTSPAFVLLSMFGVGSEISAQIVESEAWDYLDAPIERVTGAGQSDFYVLGVRRVWPRPDPFPFLPSSTADLPTPVRTISSLHAQYTFFAVADLFPSLCSNSTPRTLRVRPRSPLN